MKQEAWSSIAVTDFIDKSFLDALIWIRKKLRSARTYLVLASYETNIVGLKNSSK